MENQFFKIDVDNVSVPLFLKVLAVKKNKLIRQFCLLKGCEFLFFTEQKKAIQIQSYLKYFINFN